MGSPPALRMWAELLDMLLTLAALPAGADESCLHHLHQCHFNAAEKKHMDTKMGVLERLK